LVIKNQQRRGEFFILTETFLWAWLPILSVLTYQYLSPLYSLAISTGFAAIAFGVVVAVSGQWRELRNRRGWRDLFWSTFYILTLFACYYTALSFTSAANAAAILFLQVLFSYLYFNLFHHEPLASLHLAGALLMMAGAIVILFPGELRLNIGDLFALAAAMIAPIANRYQQRARRYMSAQTLLFGRTLFSFPILFMLAWLMAGTLPVYEEIAPIWWLLAINGFVLLGLAKLLWVEGICRIPLTKASALTAVGPICTLLFAWLVFAQTPTLWQWAGVLPVAIGGVLITRKVATS
jgi:drug/metabolite transporter (DMT)-like permease